MAKRYSVRKMGTRNGRPHYSSECNVCNTVLAHAGLSKEVAESKAQKHLKDNH